MTETLFDVTFYLAAPFWALMIFAPGWSWTKRIAASPLIILPPLALYFVLVAPILGEFAATMAGPTLAGVNDVLGSIDGTAAVWANVIAFDLFVGRWMYLDSREKGVHGLLMAPVLLLTIVLAPFGLVSYLVIRAVAAKRPAEQPSLSEG